MTAERSIPLGKYCRSSRLVLSLLPLCQGQYGSQKNNFTSVATVNLACWESSDPRSQVSDLRKTTGSLRTALISASTTTSVRFSRSLTSTTNRDCRSTSVAMKVPREPSTRSPSQLSIQPPGDTAKGLACGNPARDLFTLAEAQYP